MTNTPAPDDAIAIRLAKLEAILRTATNAIVSINPSGIIDSVNPATVSLFGYSTDELIGHNVKILMPEPYAGEHDGYLKNHLRTGINKIIGIGRKVTARRKDGSVFPVHLAVSEYSVEGQRHYTGIITDLSALEMAEQALEEAEARVAQAQRMEAVGQLAGGIAHDFNNLLSIIIGNQEILEMRMTDAKDLALLRRSQEAAEMGARLTERMLTFARRKRLEPTEINLNELLTGTVEMLRRLMGEHISLSTNLAARLWNVRADASEIENSIINLAINARDAMPHGGTLVIETANVTIGPRVRETEPKLPAGDYVMLSVGDTGIGMPPEVRRRAFEPFFTTKPAGKGTGLGLSTIHGFVEQSGGTVTITSEMGHGTTVGIYLPRSSYDGDAVPKASQPGKMQHANHETILLVEDNAGVREVARERLEGLGYAVIEAENGLAALAILEAAKHDVKLVFSDVVMPGGVSGYDIARWVAAYAPTIKVLLTSGYPEEVERAQQSPLPSAKLLRKPYGRTELAETLRQVLDS